jgi:hypothetical protein
MNPAFRRKLFKGGVVFLHKTEIPVYREYRYPVPILATCRSFLSAVSTVRYQPNDKCTHLFVEILGRCHKIKYCRAHLVTIGIDLTKTASHLRVGKNLKWTDYGSNIDGEY